MARLLRLILAAALCSTFFAAVGCEDDPHDLDYLDAGHGDHDDEDDAGK